MADVYPNVYVGYSNQENEAPDGTGGTTADADFINTITDTVYQLELMVGLAGDTAGSIGHEARIKRIEAKNNAKITQSATAPVGAVDTDLWIDTTTEPWIWNDWNGSAWKKMGANAVQVQGTNVDTTAPINNQVLTYDSGTGKARWLAQTGGLVNPMTAVGDLILGGASGAATRLSVGSTGQYLAASSAGVAWTTPPFVTIPVGVQQGDLLWYNGSAIVRLGPGSTGQFLKIASNTPVWSDLPSSPPGSSIISPSGAVIGSILEYDGTNWVVVTPGIDGQFWRTGGPGFRGTWTFPSSGSGGFANPMTNLGDIIIGDSGGAAVRLPPGALGKVLKMTSTTPSWQDDVGFNNPMTTANDIIVGGASGVAARLAKGSNGQVLVIDGSGNVAWAALSVMTNPMTTTNDLVLGGASGAPTRLAKGANNTILGVDGSGNVVWRSLATAGILSNPMTTKWDTIMADTGGTPVRLPLGGLGQVLSVVLGGSGNELGWSTPSGGGGGGGLTNPMTTAYDLIVGGTGGIPVRLGVGTNGYVLTVNGSGQVVWAAPSAGFANPMTTTGDTIYGGASGVATRLAKGADGQVLTLVSGFPAWAPATGGTTSGVARTSSGNVFYEDFNRSDRNLIGDNNWSTTDNGQGTWAIVSNQARNTSASNYDRIRNTTVNTRGAVYQFRFKAPGSGIYGGMVFMAQAGANNDYHTFFNGAGSDKKLARAGSSDTSIASGLAGTMDTTNFHTIKVMYIPDSKFVMWFDSTTASLGTIASPFSGVGGPTTFGRPGLMSYGGEAIYDWILVSTDIYIKVNGLTGGQGFRLYDSGGSVVASSDPQVGGVASVDTSFVFDGLYTGHIQIFNDAYTWSNATVNGRYPSSSNASDICAGDVYTFTA